MAQNRQLCRKEEVYLPQVIRNMNATKVDFRALSKNISLCMVLPSWAHSWGLWWCTSYGDCLEVKREYYQNCFIYCQRATSSMGTVTKTVHTARLGLEFVFVFLGCMIYLYVGVCFVLPWTDESFPFMLWRWRNKLKWAPFELFAPSPLLRVRSWLHPF